jgi:hypothetical protein
VSLSHGHIAAAAASDSNKSASVHVLERSVLATLSVRSSTEALRKLGLNRRAVGMGLSAKILES